MSQAAIQAAIAAAAAQKDMNTATAGGGDYVPPKAGVTVVTLVGYVEIGVHQHDIPNKPSWDSDDVQLIFELNGGANKAEEVDGKKIAKRITVTEKLSLNEKANFYKIFQQLNYAKEPDITHMAQLVGRHFLADVVVTSRGEGDKKRVFAGLKGPNGYNFRAPQITKQIDPMGDPLDPANQQIIQIPKPEQISESRVFLWDYANQEMWDALYIDGSYEAKDGKPAKSKNVLQNLIKSAKNWEGSPMQKILGEEALSGLADSPLAGAADTVADAAPVASEAGEDPLADLMS
ncbi:hypothetical protein Kurepalu1_00027 [Pseudomonas phage vB_PpuP-Kurepalu-1]